MLRVLVSLFERTAMHRFSVVFLQAQALQCERMHEILRSPRRRFTRFLPSNHSELCMLLSWYATFFITISDFHPILQQTRQALSSTQWSVKDLHFDYRVFTDQLLSLFKDPKNPWVQMLLDWWNKCVIYYAD